MANTTIPPVASRSTRRMSRRDFLKASGLGFAGAALLGAAGCGSGASGNGKVLNAIFLPATWGTVVQETLAPQYESETGVKVNVELLARDGIYSKLATLVAAEDSSYDIFNLDYNWVPLFAEGGHLVPLDDMLSSEDREDFFDLALRVASWEGELYGLPQTIHPHLLWYRNDLFDNPSVQDQFRAATGSQLKPPETFDEWRTIAKFFNGKTFGDRKIYGWAAQAAQGFGNVHSWLSFLFSFGAEAFNESYTKSTLATEKAIGATAQWNQMLPYTPPGTNDYTYAEVTTAAQQGTLATAMQWSWGATAVDEPDLSRTAGDWSFTQVPRGPGAQSHPHLAEWVISVPKYSRNVEEAKRFAAWLETKRNDVLQAELGAGDPVRRSSYTNPTLTEATIPGTNVKRFRRYPVVLEAMENAMPRPRIPEEERWEILVSEKLMALQVALLTSPEVALEKADAAVQEMLAS